MLLITLGRHESSSGYKVFPHDRTARERGLKAQRGHRLNLDRTGSEVDGWSANTHGRHLARLGMVFFGQFSLSHRCHKTSCLIASCGPPGRFAVTRSILRSVLKTSARAADSI